MLPKVDVATGPHLVQELVSVVNLQYMYSLNVVVAFY